MYGNFVNTHIFPRELNVIKNTLAQGLVWWLICIILALEAEAEKLL